MSGLCRVFVSHGGGASDDTQAVRVHAPELCDHLLRQTIAKVLLALLTAHVLKGKHGKHYFGSKRRHGMGRQSFHRRGETIALLRNGADELLPASTTFQ